MLRFLAGLVAGATVAVLIGWLNLMMSRAGFDFSSLVVLLILPVGAFLIGVPASFAFNLIAWKYPGSGAMRLLRGTLHFFGSILFGCGTLATFHLFEFYDLGLLTEYTTFESAFVEYFSDMTMSYRAGDINMADWGVTFGIGSYVAAGIGSLVGLAGMAGSPSTQKAIIRNQAEQVSRLALLLAMVDGEIDEDERLCCRYATKFALDVGAEHKFGVSRSAAVGWTDEIFAAAEQAIPDGAMYKDLVDQYAQAIGSNDRSFNIAVIYILASIVAREDPNDIDKQQLVLLAYIAQRLGSDELSTKEVLVMGQMMRPQILSGKLK